ncbi:LemA family protein [Novosphingobium decolorationis]|uniref:LemA family protein n=1 Tax=Novosphingobium decolorationis TaxID=2698673 RepID=A0ABX8E917_9SPHN|nr:LemA family protein [Novosphingobium decolorationis]MED5546964.1 LemA family protein [Pseudomonadota bacterium]QVM85681.1 LemA family protein [Novosphingobium decolorationis]
MTLSNAARKGRILLVGLAALSLAACGFNSVPTKQEAAKAKWADVEANFQRRANLVPNLAAVAKGAAEQEKEILTGVTEARAKATSIQITGDDLGDPAKMEQFSQAQSQLSAGLGRLMASFEAYPNITSNENYRMLQSQLEGTENRIAVSIRDYNAAVQDYNTEVRTFPSMIGAQLRGADPLVPYKATTPNADVAPSLEGKL